MAIPRLVQRRKPLADRRHLWPPRRLTEGVQHIGSRLLRSFAVRQVIKALLDFGCGLAAVALALALDAGAAYRLPWSAALGVAAGSLLVAFHLLAGGYRSIWRYASLHDAIVVGASSAVLFAVLLLARSLEALALSGSTVLLIPLLAGCACTGVRALRRWQIAAFRNRAEIRLGAEVSAPHRILIVGAGEHGLSIARDLKRPGAGVELVGFLDDDPTKRGASCNGTHVLGPTHDALELAERHDVSEVIVAMPSADPAFVRTFVRRLEDAGLRVRAVRGVKRFVTGRELHRPGAATFRELLDQPPDGNGAGERPSHHRGNGFRRVLVTGGAGYIGAHLVRMLLARGYHVRILDRFDYGRAGIEGLRHGRLEIMRGDICNSRDVGRAARDVHGVIALAAIVGDPACNLDPEETINLNYTATKILAEACSFYGVRRLVFASSCSVYGANGDGWLTERSRLNPVSLYARTRALSENILFDRCGEVEPVILRLATVFGLSPRMRFDLVVNALTVRAVVDGSISIFGGRQWRPHVHCRDVARAFTMALEAPAGDVTGEIFNVGGDGQNHRVRDLGEIISRIVGGVEIVTQDDAADPRNYRVSFQKIRRVLGFEPELPVAHGIGEIAAAVRADPALRRYQDPVYHNVHALEQTLGAPQRRFDEDLAGGALARA